MANQERIISNSSTTGDYTTCNIIPHFRKKEAKTTPKQNKLIKSQTQTPSKICSLDLKKRILEWFGLEGSFKII